MNVELTRKEAFQQFLKKNAFYITLIVMYLALAALFRFLYLMTWRNLAYDEAWTILRGIEFYTDPSKYWSSSNNQPPITTMIFGTIGLIFGNTYTTYRTTTALVGILFGLLLIIFFIQKYGDQKIALIILTVSLVIDWTLLYRFKTGDLNSFVFLIGLVSFLGIYFCMKKDTYWSNALVGVFYGVVMNTKWSLVFIILPYVFEFIFKLVTVKKQSIEENIDVKTLVKQRILKAATALGAFLIIFLPYFILILTNGSFATTFSYHSDRFTILNFEFIKYYLVYSPFIAVFGLFGLIRLIKHRNNLYQRTLLFSLASFIWLFILPSFTDFTTFYTFMPFVAFEGMISVIDFIKPVDENQSVEQTGVKGESTENKASEEETTQKKPIEKIKSFIAKLKSKIQKKGPLNTTILVIFVLFLLFPTGYLTYRFYNNSHIPVTTQFDAADYINEYLTTNPLSDNEVVMVPLTMGVLLETDQWLSLQLATSETSILEDYLLYNLTLFCLDIQFAEEEAAKNSLIFQMATNNLTEIIDSTTIHMELIIEFEGVYNEGYILYEVVRT